MPAESRTDPSQLVEPKQFGPARLFGVLAAGVVGGYLASTLGYVLTLRPAGVVFLWPPSGLMLATLVLLDRRLWPFAAGGALLGNALADYQNGAGIGLAMAGSAVNAAEQILAATVLVRLGGRRMSLGALREVGALILGAVILSNGVTAMLGALVLKGYTKAAFARGWFSWWTGDGMGMLILAPVVLTWAHAIRRRERVSMGVAFEAVAVVLGVAVVTGLLLTPTASAASGLSSHAYVVFPLLIWAGIRLGPAVATTATLALAGVTAWFAVRAALPLAGAQSSQVLEVYTYLSLASLSSLVPAAVLSERSEAVRDLQASEGRFREIADLINEAFFVVDVIARRTLYVNPGWAAIWGRPMVDGYDPNVWFEAIHPEDRPAMASAMEANARGEATDNVFRIVRPDGAVRWLRGRAFPVRDASGAVRRVAGVTADITDLRDAEQRFVQAQKLEAVGRLAGGVAHDFNNLLTVILGETESVARGALSRENGESVSEIRRAAERAAALTRQLLAFSRRQIIEPRVFDLNGALTDTARMLERLIGEDVRLDMRVAAEPLGVVADPGQMEQLITNLAVNSRDAMPGGGTLILRTEAVFDPDDGARGMPDASVERPPLGWVALSVTDSGIGMSAETLAHAFEPFFTTKERGRGTGLGLSTCHGIVTHAGGRISISSVVGKGTTVRALFPRVAVSGATLSSSSPATEPHGTERILLVEDDLAVRKVTARMLGARGYRVLEAHDATAALHQLHLVRPIDLLITDVVLPGVSGRELADIVRSTWPEIKVLFVTGYTDDVVLKGKLMSDNVALLQKPFTAEALGRRVREVLDRKA